jgi:hypothetical protein
MADFAGSVWDGWDGEGWEGGWEMVMMEEQEVRFLLADVSAQLQPPQISVGHSDGTERSGLYFPLSTASKKGEANMRISLCALSSMGWFISWLVD